MTSSDTNVDNLVVNQLTRAQYNQLCSQNKIEPDQLYFITDDKTADEVLDDRLTGYYTKSETNALSTSFRSGLQPAGNYQTKQTTLAGYGITDAKIQNGVITLGQNKITPLTAHQSLTAYAKKQDLTAYQPKGDYLTAHQSLANYYTKSETNALSTAFRSGLQTKQTTIAGYGITDAKIQNGVITLGSNTITPLTAHQSLANYYTKSQTNALSTTFRNGLVATSTLTSGYYTKTQVNNISSAISGSTDTFIDGTKNNLSVMRIAESAYRDLVKAGTALSNVLYITSSDVEDMYGERIVNVGTPVDANDAVTKAYVDEKIGDIDAILKEIIG